MIKPCPCGHKSCKSFIAPPLISCACNSLTKEQALLIDAGPDLLDALKALFSNEHINLVDLVYRVRDLELKGWNGPSVKQWSDAVTAANAALAKAKGETCDSDNG